MSLRTKSLVQMELPSDEYGMVCRCLPKLLTGAPTGPALVREQELMFLVSSSELSYMCPFYLAASLEDRWAL